MEISLNYVFFLLFPFSSWSPIVPILDCLCLDSIYKIFSPIPFNFVYFSLFLFLNFVLHGS